MVSKSFEFCTPRPHFELFAQPQPTRRYSIQSYTRKLWVRHENEGVTCTQAWLSTKPGRPSRGRNRPRPRRAEESEWLVAMTPTSRYSHQHAPLSSWPYKQPRRLAEEIRHSIRSACLACCLLSGSGGSRASSQKFLLTVAYLRRSGWHSTGWPVDKTPPLRLEER